MKKILVFSSKDTMAGCSTLLNSWSLFLFPPVSFSHLFLSIFKLFKVKGSPTTHLLVFELKYPVQYEHGCLQECVCFPRVILCSFKSYESMKSISFIEVISYNNLILCGVSGVIATHAKGRGRKLIFFRILTNSPYPPS